MPDRTPTPATLDDIETRIFAILDENEATPLSRIDSMAGARAEMSYRSIVLAWDSLPAEDRLTPRGRTMRLRLLALRSFVYALDLLVSAGPVAAGRRGDVSFLPGIHHLPSPSLPKSSTGLLPPGRGAP